MYVRERLADLWARARRPAVVLSVMCAVALLVLVVVGGYVFGWQWTGLPPGVQSGNGAKAKTLWDWLDLLLLPAVLVGVGLLYNARQTKRQEKAAATREQEAALAGYLGEMSALLLDRGLRDAGAHGVVRELARAHTLTVLRRVDSVRKGAILTFLYEAKLIAFPSAIVSLDSANLSGADLSGADLRGADLSGSNLRAAMLSHADLSRAKLSRAKLSRANLFAADLRGAILRETDLGGAILGWADLGGADLSEAILTEANLTDAGVDGEQLGSARSVKGARMPDGTVHG